MTNAERKFPFCSPYCLEREARQKLEVSENEIRMKQDSIVAAVNVFIQEYPSDRASVYLAPIMEKLFSK